MARVTAWRPAADVRWLGLGLVVALVTLALVRIAVGGWGALAPDDARYLYVGLSILDGRGPVNPSGDIFLLRSPAYGLALAAGSSLVGGDPLIGARIVAIGLTLLGLAGALRLGWLLAGPGGAVGTAVALVATPLVWRLVPTLRIDLVQTAAIVAVLLALWRPTLRRWAAGGVMLGLAILIKETALPLLLLPLALVGSMPLSRVARLAAVFSGAAVVTAAWWWVVVWFGTGRVFPLNALSVLEARDVDARVQLGLTIPLLVAIVGGWGLVAWQARHSAAARLLLVAAASLVPAALYAASLSLNARNYAALAVLSAVAVGAGGAWLVAALRDLMGDGMGTRSGGPTRTVAVVALAGVAIFALALPLIGQRAVGPAQPDRLADELTSWLSTNLSGSDRVVSAFREREEMALRRFGRGEVAILPVNRVDPAAPPETYLWMGLRDRQLFGYRRAAWMAALTEPPADVLVLVGPHPFTPDDLVAASGTTDRLGLALAAMLQADGDRAEVYRVNPTEVAAGTPGVPLHLSAEAATAWLDLAGGDAEAGRLLAARPVVAGDDKAILILLERLGDRACVTHADGGAVQIGPAGSCAD